MSTHKKRGIPDDYRKYLEDRNAVLGPDNARWLSNDPLLWDNLLEPAGPAPKGFKFLPDEVADAWAGAHEKVWRSKLMGYPDIDFYHHMLKAIRWTWSRIQLTDPPPRFKILDNQNILYNYVEYMRWLLKAREHMRSGKDQRHTLHNTILDLVRADSFTGESGPYNEEEDMPEPDRYYEMVIAITSRYYRQPTFDLGELKPEPEVEEAIAQFRAWEAEHVRKQAEREKAERAANAQQARERGFRDMPHNPDLNSMMISYDWSAKVRKESDTESKLAEARGARDAAFFEGLANACAIEGFVGYWMNHPVPQVRSRLSRSCDHMKQALEFGAQLHAWQINDQIHKAIAVNHHALITTIANLNQEAWDTDRIKPVNWLVTRIRLALDMHQAREKDLTVLLENERKWVFEETLPKELEVELPEMRNMVELLSALVQRDNDAFNKALKERTEVRTKYFDNNIAPVAMLDVQGLALCRLARKRGLKPHIQHVYLPLEMLES